MTDEQKLTLLLGVLKHYAERREHCKNSYEYPPHNWDAFYDGVDYGEITFARTLLEQIGENFEYPVMKEND